MTAPDLEALAGPRADEYHRRELPGIDWQTCKGCPSLRVFDFHYFYCRRLGDQSEPDAWNAGWKRLDGITWKPDRPAPCELPTVVDTRPEGIQTEKE